MKKARFLRFRGARGSALAEFGPVLFIVMIVVFFPAVNLLGLATGAVTLLLFTNEAVNSAASQEGFSNSLSQMSKTANQQLNGGFAKFANLTPSGGYAMCGVDLFIRVSTLGGQSTMIGPNLALSTPADVSNNVYEFVGVSKCSIGPVINMSGVPFFSEIPGLGIPAVLEMRATRMVEHPSGLTYSQTGAGGQMPAMFSRELVSGGSSGSGPSAGYNYGQWRTPDIFQQIAASGQTVVSVTVVVVQAYLPWQQTGVVVQPGQSAWIDTSAVGTWNLMQGTEYVDANGYGGSGPNMYAVAANAPGGSLVGYFGSNPPTPVPLNYGATEPTLFCVGDTLTNYPLIGPGNLSFMINDNCYTDNTGNQVVRIIITQ